ncbi:hypothetical protein GGR55DRAFT_681641 [Xylaria sp. FL0064]|nr:hypothetical protein GGR55DRAFT_681641 [Xylaria sp. FL0064]
MSTPDSPLQGVKMENEPVNDAHGLPTNTASTLDSPPQGMNMNYEPAHGLPTNDMFTLNSPPPDVNIDPEPINETHSLPANTMSLLNSPLQDVYIDYDPCHGLPTAVEESVVTPQPSIQPAMRPAQVYLPPGMSPEFFLRQMTTWNGINNIPNEAGMRANAQHLNYHSPYAAGNVRSGHSAPMTPPGRARPRPRIYGPHDFIPVAPIGYGGHGVGVGRGANRPNPMAAWVEDWADSPGIRSYQPDMSMRNEFTGERMPPPQPSQAPKRSREAQEEDKEDEEDEPKPNSEPESDSSDEEIKVEIEVYDISTVGVETILHAPSAAAQEDE